MLTFARIELNLHQNLSRKVSFCLVFHLQTPKTTVLYILLKLIPILPQKTIIVALIFWFNHVKSVSYLAELYYLEYH